MSVRKIKWKTSKGEDREAWGVDYKDATGKRHLETFQHKKAADARHHKIMDAIASGTHTPIDRDATVAAAAANWISHLEAKKLEAATIAGARQHCRDHINPKLGTVKLATLTTPRVAAFCRELVASELSPATARKIMTSFKGILKRAKLDGLLNSNPAEGVTVEASKRGAGKLHVGTDVPTREEIARIIAAATGKARPFLITCLFTGMRASELRGLRWSDVDFAKGEVHVRQRADRYNKIGRPKSATSERSIPIGPMVANTLREWRLACPKGELDLVFPTEAGKPQNHGNVYMRILRPTLAAAGIPNQYGLHSFRHFFASWCANRRVDGGRELPLRTVQQLLGHATIAMTSDRYSHFFPRSDDSAELAAAELDLIAVR